MYGEDDNDYEEQRRRQQMEQAEELRKLQAQIQKEKDDSGKLILDEESGMQKIFGGRNFYGNKRPDYYTMRNADGDLHDKFKQTLGESLTKIKDRANTVGDTDWAKMQREKLDTARTNSMDSAQKSSAGNVANNMQSISMRGGLQGGASERMAMSANRNLMDQQQNIQSDHNSNNLDLSIQDDTQKQNMLGQIGKAEQLIQNSNIGALQNDYMRQNDTLSKFYEADNKAWGAKQTADAQRNSGGGGGCFLAGQKVQLLSGEMVCIEDIEVGDELMYGGEVYQTMITLNDHYYNYEGVRVTGAHLVLEDGVWMRVDQSELKGERIHGDYKVYNLCNDEHSISINGVMFADFDEVDGGADMSQEDALEILNG